VIRYSTNTLTFEKIAENRIDLNLREIANTLFEHVEKSPSFDRPESRAIQKYPVMPRKSD